ncbi:hypothetical protein [Paragemmobacter ruber]|uniref:Uncharacterized protein n=1 Tax=Paragemmobacter ruber TaxID=1985673 RepID=A0ABW9Y4U5_9RHOB|nr:hypothetical protein [Rhodobacter ruber]NBE07523.1 hypothetical protein [Rhodobacter ruber]
MSNPIPHARPARAHAAALAALEQMFGYYAYAWQPFAPARSPDADRAMDTAFDKAA